MDLSESLEQQGIQSSQIQGKSPWILLGRTDAEVATPVFWSSDSNSCCCCCYYDSVMPDSVQPHRRQPTRLPRPWDSPGKTLEWVAIAFSGFEQLTNWKSPWCWERLKTEGKEGVRGWNGWMASPMQRTWTWATWGDGEGQRGLVCCSLWGHKVSDMTGQLNNMIHYHHPNIKVLNCTPESNIL